MYHLSHGCSTGASNANVPWRRTKMQAVGSTHATVGARLTVLASERSEPHYHPQEVSLL